MSLPSAVVKNLDPVQIVKDSDATISVRCRYKGSTRYTRSFGVNKALLIKNSEYFKRSFRFNDANGHSEIRLDGDNIAAIQIWLIYLHIASDTTDTDISPPMKQALAIKKTTIHTIWSLIVVADKYDFKVSPSCAASSNSGTNPPSTSPTKKTQMTHATALANLHCPAGSSTTRRVSLK
jgi:hypothetical protein